MTCPNCGSNTVEVDDEDDRDYGIVYRCVCRKCAYVWKVDGSDY